MPELKVVLFSSNSSKYLLAKYQLSHKCYLILVVRNVNLNEYDLSKYKTINCAPSPASLVRWYSPCRFLI